jgi:hypothetical protein
VLSLERALLDCAAVVVRLHLTFRVKPPNSRTVWKTGACGLLAIDQEITRAPIKWPLEFRIWKPRSVDDRLIITGEEPRRFPSPGDPHGPEILFKEFARLGRTSNFCSRGPPASVQETVVDRPWVVRPLAGEKRLAARQKGREGRSVIVGRPAVEIGPFDRLELRIGDVQRICTGAMRHADNTHQPRRCSESKVFPS